MIDTHTDVLDINTANHGIMLEDSMDDYSSLQDVVMKNNSESVGQEQILSSCAGL